MPLIILPAIVISSIFFSKKNYDAYYTPYIMRFLNILFLWKKNRILFPKIYIHKEIFLLILHFVYGKIKYRRRYSMYINMIS